MSTPTNTVPARSEADIMILVCDQLRADARAGVVPRVPTFGELRGDISCGGSTDLSRTFYGHLNAGKSVDVIADAVGVQLRG